MRRALLRNDRETVAALAGALGLVHCPVALSQQLVWIGLCLGARRVAADAEARADTQAGVGVEIDIGDHPYHHLGNPDRVRAVADGFHQDDELVAAPARKAVGLPYVAGD